MSAGWPYLRLLVTLRRAFRDVGGEAIREGNEGLKPKWVWRLPAAQKVV
jgi:hypothetical protein